MKIQFTGYKKTKENFLTKLSKISSDIKTLKDNLSQLNIFSYMSVGGNKMTVVEDKNKISLMSKGKNKNCLNITFPNIFGSGENVDFSFNSTKEYKIAVSKPFIFSKCLLFADFNSSRCIKKILNKEYTVDKQELGIRHKYLDVGIGLDKYLFVRGKYSFVDFNIKKGLDFLKITTDLKFYYNLAAFLQYKLLFRTGIAQGNINQVDKFYLGDNIKGYKNNSILPSNGQNNGGRSFLEITNKLVFKMKTMDLYFFNSIGFNHAKENIFEYICKPEIQSPGSLGHSVGLGLNVPLRKDDYGPNIDISLAYPLLKNKDTETYAFSFDIQF